MKRLLWQDPEPIEDNDYIITTVDGKKCNTFGDVSIMFYKKGEKITDDTILTIHYNDGQSEAEVTPDEIIEVDVEYNIWLNVEQRIIYPDGDEQYDDLDDLIEKRGAFDTLEEVKRDLNTLK